MSGQECGEEVIDWRGYGGCWEGVIDSVGVTGQGDEEGYIVSGTGAGGR